MYEKQLHSLVLSAYIHLSGVNTLEDYSYWKNGDFSIIGPSPLLPPAVIKSTNTCIKRLNMSIEQYKELYLSIITPTLTPAHVFGKEKTLDIICTYLDGQSEKADKMVASGIQKFKKELFSKQH
jgi:hypothetical protein